MRSSAQGLSFLGTVLAARRAARAAITGPSPEVIKLMLASPDPARRAKGYRMLDALAQSFADDPDAPDELKQEAGREIADRATSTPDMERALGAAESLSAQGEDVDFDVQDGAEESDDPQR
ncbi:hypothetical protein [Kineococcus sp. SYSU DK005]|uniref:hypothetical protein n=1 Tax=Kineococcus sp. SYSU DK005 TaxID=3383126 RepID=UPI003D7EEEF3